MNNLKNQKDNTDKVLENTIKAINSCEDIIIKNNILLEKLKNEYKVYPN